MIRCNNCMRQFADDSKLAKILEIQIAPDDVTTVIYTGQEFDEKYACVFNGCPTCLTDGYLMYLQVNTNINDIEPERYNILNENGKVVNPSLSFEDATKYFRRLWPTLRIVSEQTGEVFSANIQRNNLPYERTTESDGSVCYTIGDTKIFAKESYQDSIFQLEPIKGSQVLRGKCVALTMMAVENFCIYLSQQINEEKRSL